MPQTYEQYSALYDLSLRAEMLSYPGNLVVVDSEEEYNFVLNLASEQQFKQPIDFILTAGFSEQVNEKKWHTPLDSTRGAVPFRRYDGELDTTELDFNSNTQLYVLIISTTEGWIWKGLSGSPLHCVVEFPTMRNLSAPGTQRHNASQY